MSLPRRDQLQDSQIFHFGRVLFITGVFLLITKDLNVMILLLVDNIIRFITCLSEAEKHDSLRCVKLEPIVTWCAASMISLELCLHLSTDFSVDAIDCYVFCYAFCNVFMFQLFYESIRHTNIDKWLRKRKF